MGDLDPTGLEAAAEALVDAQPTCWAKEYLILPNRVKAGAKRIAEATIRAYETHRIDKSAADPQEPAGV
jgi:hypothetical protein